MLLTKKVQVKIVPTNKKYYESLGYTVHMQDIISVPINHLQKGSNVLVDVKCDYCGKEFQMEYYRYINAINGITSKISCLNCRPKKMAESNLSIFGVDNPSKLPETHKKMEETTLARYGAKHYLQTEEGKNRVAATNIKKYGGINPSADPEVREKAKQTNLERYGVDNPTKSPEIIAKMKANNLEKYGVENTFCSEESKEKMKQTSLKNWGVEFPMQSPIVKDRQQTSVYKKYGVKFASQNKEIAQKARNTLYENQSVATSLAQKYLAKLFNLELNYPIKYWNVDMCDVENKIIVEYDGGGHDLNVRLGHLTQEEFDRKELKRSITITKQGYKMIYIISRKDKFPADEVLLKMYSEACEYFSSTLHTWVKYDIDNKLMINAEHRNGVSYHFGELKKFYNYKQYTESISLY